MNQVENVSSNCLDCETFFSLNFFRVLFCLFFEFQKFSFHSFWVLDRTFTLLFPFQVCCPPLILIEFSLLRNLLTLVSSQTHKSLFFPRSFEPIYQLDSQSFLKAWFQKRPSRTSNGKMIHGTQKFEKTSLKKPKKTNKKNFMKTKYELNKIFEKSFWELCCFFRKHVQNVTIFFQERRKDGPTVVFDVFLEKMFWCACQKEFSIFVSCSPFFKFLEKLNILKKSFKIKEGKIFFFFLLRTDFFRIDKMFSELFNGSSNRNTSRCWI